MSRSGVARAKKTVLYGDIFPTQSDVGAGHSRRSWGRAQAGNVSDRKLSNALLARWPRMPASASTASTPAVHRAVGDPNRRRLSVRHWRPVTGRESPASRAPTGTLTVRTRRRAEGSRCDLSHPPAAADRLERLDVEGPARSTAMALLSPTSPGRRHGDVALRSAARRRPRARWRRSDRSRPGR